MNRRGKIKAVGFLRLDWERLYSFTLVKLSLSQYVHPWNPATGCKEVKQPHG